MKPTYKGFEAKKSGGYVDLPPVGAYVAEIKNIKLIPGEDGYRDKIECYMEIIEGEYADRFTEVWKDQQERFGEARYKGIFSLICPFDNDEDWRTRAFQSNLWCVQESNPGYFWDWDEKKLKGKKVGINIRKRLYTYNGKHKETIEIGQFETIEDVKAGKCKQMKPRDQRKPIEAEDSTDGSDFTEVSDTVDVPWPTN